MFYERKTVVSDFRIPAGYQVTHHENRGYDSPDRWYEAHEGKRKVGEFAYKEDAIEACVKDAEERGWNKTRYERALENDGAVEAELPPDMCYRCGKTKHEDGSQVRWKCRSCEKTICRACTLTIPGSCPVEYYEQTLCSHACWIQAGRPEE